MVDPQTLLDFWFGAPGSDSHRTMRKEWFRKDEAFDEAIRQSFGPAVEWALAGGWADWEGCPEGRLALILLLDQLPRNLYRGSARAFAGDGRALLIAKAALAEGDDRRARPEERLFLYLPFEHSEQLADQRTSLALFRALGDGELLEYAVRHHAIVARFGRFPHRNEALGRISTAEEIEFLKQPGSHF